MDSIRIIAHGEKLYPPLLSQLPDAPKQLFVRGNIDILSHPHILAVVGSRKASNYGKQCIEHLLPPVASNDIIIVSGLAFGIDSLAHQASVYAKKPTIAVLGSGVDDPSIYPRPNLALAHSILKYGGALVSEYPPTTAPLKYHFPARNRIVAGLAQATLIIQANAKSGSLITAQLALDYNRDVAAVPGAITDPLSSGTNSLLREGAHMITDSQDLLDIFHITAHEAAVEKQRALPLDHQKVIEFITSEAKHVDDLIVFLHKPAHEVTTLLLEMELAGHVQHVGGMKYVKK